MRKNEEEFPVENVLQENVAAKSKNISIALIQFIVLMSAAILAPIFNIQILTGTLVNATLFITAAVLGVPAAIMIGIVPSIISGVTGLLPAVILPMVPFIIISNMLLVVTFSKTKNASFMKGVAAASFVKFSFLLISSFLVVKFLVPVKVASQILLMMSYPQLVTALSGGILAYLILEMIKAAKERH